MALQSAIHASASLIDESCGQLRRLHPARRILQTADGRLRGQRRTACRTAADRHLHQLVMPQTVEVDGILSHAIVETRAITISSMYVVLDAARIAPIRHCHGKASAYPGLALRLPQQQQTSIRGLVAALKIDCEFLAMRRWQVERK